MSHFYDQTYDAENKINKAGEDHGVFMDSYSAVLAKDFTHW